MRRWPVALEDPAHTADDTREFGPAHDICPRCGSCRCPDCLDCVCEDHEPHFSYEPCDEPEDA